MTTGSQEYFPSLSGAGLLTGWGKAKSETDLP